MEKKKNKKLWFAVAVLPAAATLYTVLSGTWGLPFGQEIPATMTALSAFICAVMGFKKED